MTTMPGIKGPHWKDTLIDFGLQFLCIYSFFLCNRKTFFSLKKRLFNDGTWKKIAKKKKNAFLLTYQDFCFGP